MLSREQQVGYVLAGVVAAGSVAIAGIGVQNFWAASAGVAASVALYFAVRHGQRIITAIAAFLAALAVFYFLPLELACLIFGGYLTMRSSSAQKKARLARPPVSAAERRAAAQARAAARTQRRKGAPAQATTPKTPAPNRRYTPPKAKPPTPPKAKTPTQKAPKP